MSVSTYSYEAVDNAGRIRRGVIEAASSAEAYRQIRTRGITPTRVSAKHSTNKHAWWNLSSSTRKVRQRDIAHLTYQLSALLAARIPISDGLMSIADQEGNVQLAVVMRDVAKRIEAGNGVAASLAAHEKVFGDVYIATVRAAERTGTLVEVLDHLSEVLEREEESRRQLRSAMLYPTCVVSVLVLAIVFLVGYVVPKFSEMFAQRGVELPTLTMALMETGQSLQRWWWVYAIVIATAVWGVRWAWKRDSSRAWVERILHRVPYLRSILRGVAVSRFAHVLGLSLRAGLGLLEGLELAGSASGRAMLAADVEQMRRQVKGGGMLSEVVQECDYLPPFARRMICAGETSGELPRLCGTVARSYERETAHLVKNISTVLEPVMVVGVASVVLIIALAIFLPMWDMASLLD